MESDRKKQLHVTKHILKRFQACVPHVQRRPGIRNSVSVLIRHLKAPSLPPRARERGEERARESRRRQKRKRRSGGETYENFLLIIASWLWKAICFPCISIGVFHKFITRGNMSIDFHLCVALTIWYERDIMDGNTVFAVVLHEENKNRHSSSRISLVHRSNIEPINLKYIWKSCCFFFLFGLGNKQAFYRCAKQTRRTNFSLISEAVVINYVVCCERASASAENELVTLNLNGSRTHRQQ